MGDKMIYVTGNLVEDASTVTVSSEDSTYIKDNLFNRRPGKPFKFTTTGGRITLNFGSAVSVSFCGIVGHNFSSGATAFILFSTANNSTAWASPAAKIAVSWANINQYATFFTQSYQYARVTVSGNTATAKIGELVVQVYKQVGMNYRWGYREHIEAKNINNETDRGQVWSKNMYKFKSWELMFETPDATKEQIATLASDTYGEYIPFCFITYESQLKYVKMNNKSSFTKKFLNWNRYQIKFREVPLGEELD